MQVLAKAGVSFEVVPGVTAALVAAAAARIPLTLRGVSASLTLTTGISSASDHADAEGVGTREIARLVVGGGTVAVYMGLRVLREIAEALPGHGVGSDLPVAVIGHAFMPDQALVFGTLHDIFAKATEAGVASPALVVFGEVAGCRAPESVM